MHVIIAGAFWFAGSSAEGGGGLSFAVKKDGSVITHTGMYTRVMIWEIRRGVGGILRRRICSIVKFSCKNIPVHYFFLYFFIFFLFMHLPDNWIIL